MQTNQQQITAYFPDRASAQRAMNDLDASGVPADDMELRDKDAGSGFLETIKRLFTGESYENYAGGSLLTVYGDRSMVLPVLQQYGARVGDDDADVRDGDWTDGTTDSEAMTLREERLSVDKRPVTEGEVTLRKRVVTEQQSIDVPVTHEEVYVTRRPVAEGEYDAGSGDLGEDREISVPVMHEEVSVQKRPVVTEEVQLNKRRVQETQPVSATVRKERAEVNTTGDVEDNVDSSL